MAEVPLAKDVMITIPRIGDGQGFLMNWTGGLQSVEKIGTNGKFYHYNTATDLTFRDFILKPQRMRLWLKEEPSSSHINR